MVYYFDQRFKFVVSDEQAEPCPNWDRGIETLVQEHVCSDVLNLDAENSNQVTTQIHQIQCANYASSSMTLDRMMLDNEK